MATHYQGTPAEILALDTFIKLSRAATSFTSRLHQHATRGDLTPSQFGVLEAIYYLGPLCQSEISAKLLLSTGNMTMVVDNLEKRGLVRRERNPDDRRYVIVSLTKTGRQMIASLLPNHIAAILEEMSTLTPKEQQMLGRLCRRLGKKETN